MSVYSTQKLAFHPDAIHALRHKEPIAPKIVQLMPSNVCNHACEFCSYGSGPESIRAKIPNPPKAAWKNQQLFGTRDQIPREKLREIVTDCADMGVQCIELTGGGEPTVHPDFLDLCRWIREVGLELALVTNGTLLTQETVTVLHEIGFTWARVSIDAGTLSDYVEVRHCSNSHWDRAWHAVKMLSGTCACTERVAKLDCTVGVGFVVDRTNWKHVGDAIVRAEEYGAENIRISAAFTPEECSRFDRECLTSVHKQVEHARSRCSRITIYDLLHERWHNLVVHHQTYPFCAWKEIGCVIGADQNVYSCCSWAYNRAGFMASVQYQSFKEAWFGEGWAWRQQHDPRVDCRIHCLYEARNIEALKIMASPQYAAELQAQEPPQHVNFI